MTRFIRTFRGPAAFLALVCAMGAATARAQCTTAACAVPTCTVNGTGPDGLGCCVTGCATIQGGVDDALAGAVISVLAGTYPEAAAGPLNINKSVTLCGAQANADARTRVGAESIITDPQGTQISASNVVVNGFTIEQSTNNAFTGYGLWMSPGTTGTRVLNDIVQNNIIGIGLANTGGSQVLICQNLIQNNNQQGSATGTGIYTDQFVSGGAVSNVLIEDNTFQGNADAGIDFSNTDVANGVSNVEIATNLFDMNGRGVLLFNTHTSTIHNNSITNSTLAGSAAIRLFDNNSDLSITFNDIDTGAGRGIRLSDIDAVDTGNPNPSSGVVINDNNIVNFAQEGLLVDVGSHTGTVNAECNWWGDASGPSGDGPGTGEPVVGDADFTPWLVAPSPAPATGQVDCSGGVATTTTSTTEATTTSTTATTVTTTTATTATTTSTTMVQVTTSTTVTHPSSTTTVTVSTSTTTTQPCVPSPEICNDMIDNDCDGKTDCVDPDCDNTPPCPVAHKDPTSIKFSRSGGLDSIKGHATLESSPIDVSAVKVGILLSDLQGNIYDFTLPPGAMQPPGGKTFRYRNSDARLNGGVYQVKIKQRTGGYSFSFAAYGDLSGADNPNMRLQFYMGDAPKPYVTIDAPWIQTPSGWRAPKDH